MALYTYRRYVPYFYFPRSLIFFFCLYTFCFKFTLFCIYWKNLFQTECVYVKYPLIDSQLRDSIGNKDREVFSLRRQLDSVSSELAENVRSREISLKENRRLLDDLTSMTRENQVRFIPWPIRSTACRTALAFLTFNVRILGVA